MMKNKYQEAIKGLIEYCDEVIHVEKPYPEYLGVRDNVECLEKLVDKETPMKPIYQYEIDWGMGNAGECPDCKNLVNYQNSYCGRCGQKIDWGSVDE